MKKKLKGSRGLLYALVLCAASSTSSGSAAEVQHSRESGGQPNLLFIMTDQQRFDALSYAGNTVLHTPNMDRLAREGVWFENAHTQCAVCGPARASMLTGYSVANTKVISNRKAYLPEADGVMPMKTYDEILSEHGYKCEYHGKWHAPLHRAKVYGNPVTMAGTHETELGPGHKEIYIRYLNPLYPDRELQGEELKDTFTDRPYVPDPIDKRFDLKRQGKDADINVGQSDIHGVTRIPARYHLPAFQAGDAMRAMEKLKDEPFSITCSFHHPHPPYLATEEYIGMYPPETMVPPASLGDGMSHSPYRNMKKNTSGRYSDPKMIQYFISEYYALVKEVDDEVGRILNTLDALGLTDNTMVVFTSDHGEMLGSHGMRGKFCFYEESSHVPMIIRFPGRIRPGIKVKAPVSNMDLFATILDYLELPAHPSDGNSLRGLVEGTVDEEDAYVVTEWLSDPQGKPTHMVLKGGWKLMRPDPSAEKVETALYNLNNDPHELKNLLADKASQEAHAARVAELEACFQDWTTRTGLSRR
jgi:arylsulfatase A-like enzyme